MTSTSQLTEEERNFARFFFLNFKVSPDIARRFFDGVFPPTHLAQIINNNMRAIISLNKSRRINAAQLEILRAVTGTVWPPSLPPMPVGTKATSSKDFDLTMIICLLRNLGGLSTPSNGWDQLPLPNDMLPGADLATLKWYRNQLAHTTVSSMDTNEFADKWTRVEKALSSLNKGQRPREITVILNYDLNGEQAKTLANAELSQLKKEYMDCEKEKEQIERDFSYYREGNLPKNIADANATFVETWLKDDKSFYETKGSEIVYNKVKDCSCILVTSNSGSGKTAAIRHIALKLQPEGFEIVPVESPEDIIIYRTNKKQVFLIDDVLGKYDLSPTLLDKWEILNENLISCLETKLSSKKILCTLRSQIACNKRFKNASSILNKEVINLESESISLSKEEKQKILIKHLTIKNLENEITPEEVEIMCETNYAFPLLCKLVSIDEERFRKRIAFFSQPYSLLKEELDKMSNENKKLYCILVLCMLFNGSFSRRIFYIDSDEYDAKINRIMQTCGLQRNMPKKELEDSALSALGSYFIMENYSFRFIHDALEETTGWHFHTFDPRVMFSDCDILFIRDRVRVHSNENMNANVDENIVVIRENELNEDHITPLYTRVWTELNKGRFSTLLMGPDHIFKNRNFIRIFGTRFETNLSKLGSKTIFWKTVSSERRSTINRSDLTKFVKILSTDELQEKAGAIGRVLFATSFRSTLMHWIVALGCNEFFQYAWSKMTTSDRNSILGRDFIFIPSVKSFFPLAVLGGSLDIVSKLISDGADVNCFSESKETPLYLAVKSGNYDMVSLLVKNGAKVNLRGWFAMKVPIAVAFNKHELTSLILGYDLNQTELHRAVRHNDLENLKLNILSENIDSKTQSGWTVLHYAVLLNNLEAVKVLFHEELPQNDDSYFDFMQVDQRESLCRKLTPTVSIVDNNGLTAVHIAVINNNIDILSLLLCYKAKVKVFDVFNRTPLHYTTSESVTKLLLTHTIRNNCLWTNRNVEEEEEYDKMQMSAFRTMCFNMTLHNSFRNICRDFVNMPDWEGNTPLHSVIKRCISKKETIDCVETLIVNGANPFLYNDSGTSALRLIKSSCDTVKYINNSAKYKQSIQKTHKEFASIMFILMSVTFVLAIHLSSLIRKESQNAFFCVEQFAGSGKITLVQVTRSINVILLTILLLVLLSIMFNMRYLDLLRRSFLLFSVLILLGCFFFILFGSFAYIQIINRFFYSIIYVGIICSVFIKIIPFFKNVLPELLHHSKRGNIRFLILLSLLIFVFLLVFYVSIKTTMSIDNVKFDNFYNMRNINKLNITASNCTEFSSVNISCTSLAYGITYKHDVDFSVQCLSDPNITSYNNTHGTLTVESGFIDMSEMYLMTLFCLNLSLHATCVYCFLHSIYIVFGMKIFGEDIIGVSPCINGVAVIILYADIYAHMFFY